MKTLTELFDQYIDERSSYSPDHAVRFRMKMAFMYATKMALDDIMNCRASELSALVSKRQKEIDEFADLLESIAYNDQTWTP
jgi:hypothetical protein